MFVSNDEIDEESPLVKAGMEGEKDGMPERRLRGGSFFLSFSCLCSAFLLYLLFSFFLFCLPFFLRYSESLLLLWLLLMSFLVLLVVTRLGGEEKMICLNVLSKS
jgi:hypothetical protein